MEKKGRARSKAAFIPKTISLPVKLGIYKLHLCRLSRIFIDRLTISVIENMSMAGDFGLLRRIEDRCTI